MAGPKFFSNDPAARRRVFKTALAYLGETRLSWAARHGVNVSTLNAVGAQARHSPAVDALIDETIQTFRRRVVRDIPLPRQAAGAQ